MKWTIYKEQMEESCLDHFFFFKTKHFTFLSSVNSKIGVKDAFDADDADDAAPDLDPVVEDRRENLEHNYLFFASFIVKKTW